MKNLTIVIPAKNEVEGLKLILPKLSELGCSIILVDDASTDETREYALSMGVNVITHKQGLGNGGAVKSGLKAATTKYVGVMDGDGQHSVEDMVRLYDRISNCELDLIVGERSRSGQASMLRGVANGFYNWFAGLMVNRNVKDLTSGQRVFLTKKIKPIIWLLPNTFSYPTTSTMIFYRLGYAVDFLPIEVKNRVGQSHINILRDGFRFFLIIMKIGTLYSPFKLFVPIALSLFFCGVGRYAYTFFTQGTFTNMSALLLVSSVIVFLMGVLSEQVSMAVFANIEKKD